VVGPVGSLPVGAEAARDDGVGRPVTPLSARTPMQLIFIAAAVAVAAG
jgi:hypothetical protein